jgi:L-iditol 2-dehydrogenase
MRSPTIPDSMQAVVYRGANDLRLETLPVPEIRSDELLVKVAACGVCPTDIKKIQNGTVPPPRVFGHETAGVIVKVGSRARGFRVGDRVGLHHHVPCLDCHPCRHRNFAQCEGYKRTGITAGFEPAGGGYAEYVRVMPFVLPGVVRIPARNDFLEGAMLEPVNTVLKAVRRLRLLRGDIVLVFGQGPIGLMFTRLLALAGFRVIATDLHPVKLNLAREFGAWRTLRADRQDLPKTLGRLAGRAGIDASVVAVAVDATVEQALSITRNGGQILLFSHTKRGARFGLDLASVCVDEKDLLGSYSSDFLLQKEVADLVFRRKIDVRRLVSHRFPLDGTPEAVRLGANPTSDSLKIVVVQSDESTVDGPSPEDSYVDRTKKRRERQRA